jgi:hypothetical protein
MMVRGKSRRVDNYDGSVEQTLDLGTEPFRTSLSTRKDRALSASSSFRDTGRSRAFSSVGATGSSFRLCASQTVRSTRRRREASRSSPFVKRVCRDRAATTLRCTSTIGHGMWRRDQADADQLSPSRHARIDQPVSDLVQVRELAEADHPPRSFKNPERGRPGAKKRQVATSRRASSPRHWSISVTPSRPR